MRVKSQVVPLQMLLLKRVLKQLTDKTPSEVSCDKEKETIMLKNSFPDQGVHQQNLCGIKHTCELVYCVKSPTEKVSKFQHSMLS